MLTGEYNLLVDNMWLTDIIAVILLIIPFFLIFYDSKWIFTYYVISIVANLPLIFIMTFGFSYELIIGFLILVAIVKDSIRKKKFILISTKESRAIFFALLGVLVLNIITSLFNFNRFELLLRFFIYIVNLFILIVYNFYLVGRKQLEFVKRGFLIGAFLLFVSMLAELIYGHYYLGLSRLRPGGLLIDPNVAAFALNISLLVSFFKTGKLRLLETVLLIIIRILIIFGVFLTVSRSGYLGTLLIIVSLLIYYSQSKNRVVIWITSITLILMYLVFYKIIMNFIDGIYQIIDLQRIFPRAVPPTNSNGGIVNPGFTPVYEDSRITLLKGGVKMFIANYILGVGIGNVVIEMETLNTMPMNTHNLVLQLIAESGIFMLVMLMIFAYYILHLLRKSQKKFFIFLIILLVFLESLFNHNLLNLNIIYLLLAFLLAINIIYSKEQLIFSFSKRKRSTKNRT